MSINANNGNISREQFQQYADTNKDATITQGEYQALVQTASKLVADIQNGKTEKTEGLKFLQNIGLITESNEVNPSFSIADLRKANSIISKPSLTPPDPIAVKKLSSYDEITELMKMLMALYLLIRDAHFRGDMLDLQGIRAAFEGKFSKMEEELTKRYNGAIAKGIAQFAMGTVQCCMAGASALSASRISAAGKSVNPATGSQQASTAIAAGATGTNTTQTTGQAVNPTPANLEKNLQELSARSTQYQSMGSASNSYLEGVGSIIEGMFARDADKAKLEGDKQQANLEMWRASEEMDKKFMEGMIQSLLSILQSLEEARRNTAQTEMRVATV